MRAARNSLALAGTSAAIATALATLAAVVMWAREGRGKTVIESLIGVPLIVPEIVMAIATLLLFSALSIDLSFYTVLLAHVAFCLPFAYLPIRARLRRIDPLLLDAAADLSATPWAAFRQITLPLALPGIAAGAMLAFLTSMDDFVITYFVAGPGVTTLPMYIFGALKFGLTPKINAISTIMLALSAIVAIVGSASVRSDATDDARDESPAGDAAARAHPLFSHTNEIEVL